MRERQTVMDLIGQRKPTLGGGVSISCFSFWLHPFLSGALRSSVERQGASRLDDRNIIGDARLQRCRATRLNEATPGALYNAARA